MIVACLKVEGTSSVRLNHKPELHKVMCAMLGDLTYGLDINVYTHSGIENATYTKKGVKLKKWPDQRNMCDIPQNQWGSYIMIRTNNNVVMSNFDANFDNFRDRNLFDGLRITDVMVSLEDNITSNYFRTMQSSPICLTDTYRSKKQLDSDDIKNVNEYLLENIKKKAKNLNFTLDPNLSIKVARQHKSHYIRYRKAVFTGRFLVLNILANPETKEFIMLNGLGRSNGIGLGMIESIV